MALTEFRYLPMGTHKTTRSVAMLTGIERKQIEEAQARLKRRRYERDHFSDGSPVTLSEAFAPEHSSFGVIYDESEPELPVLKRDRYTAPLGE